MSIRILIFILQYICISILIISKSVSSLSTGKIVKIIIYVVLKYKIFICVIILVIITKIPFLIKIK